MGTGKQRSKFAMGVLILGVFMSALDNGIIAIALSSINYSFHISEVQGTWGITLYTLGMAIATPIIGKLADKFGRRKLFLIEIAIFGLGSLLVALSPTFLMFLLARMIQSVGGGGIFVIASSHILSTYPKKAQGRLLGALGAVNGIASVVGPNLGSLILNLTGRWNWLFLINLPIAIFVIVAGWLVIPETIGSHVKSLDLKGLTILSVGIFSIMLAITNLQSGHLLGSLLTPQVWGAGLVGIGLFVGFVLVEKRISPRFDPFLPYHLLANKGFLLTLLMGLLSGMLIAIFVFIPSFVGQVYGVSANNSGIWMSGIGLGSILGAGIDGTLVSRLGAAKTVIVSGGLSAMGFAMIAFLSPAAGWFLATSTLAGFGFGMLMGAPLSVLMAQFADQADNGVALGTLSVSRQVGLTIAPTIYATIIQSGFSRLSLTTPLEEYYRNLLAKATGSHSDKLATFYQIAQQAYQHLFVVAVVISLIILAGGWILIRRRGSKNIA